MTRERSPPALARAVGDPTLELALWIPDREEFVDEAGRPIDTHAIPPGRALTAIGPQGEPLAALIHDERLLGQRALLEAAGSAARLALENTRLQAELRAQLAELRGSRARIAGGFLPTVWLPDEQTRILRRRISARAQLVRQRTRAKNQVHATWIGT